MSTLHEAAQEFIADYENGDLGDLKHYARALRAALAQQEQEPVAWMMINREHATLARSLHWKPQTDWHITWEAIPLYTHPPRREWQGLTTQEAMALTDTVPKGTFYGCDAGISLGIWIAAVAAAEQALRSKNG